MANVAHSSTFPLDQEQNLWENLKTAIADSSGFKRWQEEQLSNDSTQENNLDERVNNYLRETLEALAY